MLRWLWFMGVALTLTVWHGGLVILGALVGIPNREGGLYDKATHRWGRRLLRASGVPYRVIGVENVPRDGSVVFVCNHQSAFDIFLLATVIPIRFRFVAKKELLKVPVFGRAMRTAGHIPIDRQNRQRAFGAYERAAEIIRGGTSALVFGEGTRSRTGQLQSFKKGPFVLAIAAGVPVVPVYCAGTFTTMPKGSWKLDRSPIAIMFGNPISTDGLDYEDREELMKKTEAAIKQLRVDSQTLLG